MVNDDREVEQGQYLLEVLTVQGARPLSINPPPGYFFLSSAPCACSTRVLVTWRKVLNETDPGPAPPATAAGNVRRLKLAKKAKKKKASKRAPGRR